MNKKSILLKTAALTAVFALNANLYVALNKKASEVEASSYSVNSVPTTINLNDASESTIRSYYSSLNNLSASERSGTNLLKNLKPILRNGQKYFSYGSSATTAVWKAYEIVDRDWNKSPASAISGYNAQTNTITGYVYGTSNSDVGTNPYIHALYVNRNVNNEQRAWGNHNQEKWGINQEHLWAKSCGFDDESPAAGARGDLMHLWAGNGRVNGTQHSNYYYGYVDTSRTYDDAGDDVVQNQTCSNLSGNRKGYSRTLGGSTYVFEPQDSDKGDIARAIFYMAARYNYLSGSDSDGIDAGNPNLEIVNNVSSWQNSGYQSSTSKTGKMGILQDLLEWNRLDPPDEWEIHRNNILYNSFTKNRNPFIDFPSWADAIWGVSENGNYNSTPTKSASPTSDPINTFTASSFSISESEIELEVGDTAEISGSNANGNITWSVADSSVISLDKTTTTNNVAVTITALSAGSTTITATNGGNNATCTVTVTQPINYGTLENPLTVDEAINVISITGTSETAQPLYVKGAVSSNSAYNTQYSNYDYAWLKSNDGSEPQAFELFRFKLDSGVEGDYSAANSLVDKEVVAYGYGKIYNTTYELTTSSNTPNNPLVLSITDQTDTPDNPSNYITPSASFASISGRTQASGNQNTTDSIVFANLGLNNAQQYLNPFIENGLSVTFAGGDNDGRYYDTGTGIRTYGGGTITVSATGLISSITFVWSGSNKPATGDVANVGTYNVSTGVWTGSATSVTLTRSSGSGHWRLQSVTATYLASSISVDNVAMRFGASISIEDWTTIDETWGVDDFGVICAKKTTMDSYKTTYGITTVKDAFLQGKYVTKLGNNNNLEHPYPVGDNYVFTIRIGVSSPNNYLMEVCAVPYIQADGQYYFFDEIDPYSVKTLAQYYLDNPSLECALSNSALRVLAASQGGN